VGNLGEITVTRKYQITIPKKTRTKLGIEIGDKLLIREEEKRIIIEVPEKTLDPSEYLWSLSEEPQDIDAVKLVEESWKET
jgi:AbrB family looped-hinge helix DNA binding protein